ncbi:NAD(P)/FAD-dependent oxidoreductase [uncultured Jannaschia sp.]|uniref:flavin monoamine oxidase family protein n=1 Tax=uncultured Jannaschia sp. TaxID=293347 RepID=UPI00261A21F5|nr:NAD(P)/FAD-dependent oxidoreductase [uncultured Jannaschia sp.]
MLDTVIVGAGFAGLSAARTLITKGREGFVILEARDRVGGRTKPGVIGNLDIDLGGMWMAPGQARLKRLAAHYRVRPYPTYLDGNAVFRISKRERQGPREDLSRLFGIGGGLAYLHARWKLERLMAPLDTERPWAHPEAERLDAMTVETWIARNVLHPLPRVAFRTVCATILCAEPSQVSLLFFLHYLKSGGGLEVLISSDTGGAQNLLFHGGVHQISRFMADEIGERLRLEAAVSAIEWNDDAVTVHSERGRFTARKAIIAVPPTLLRRIRFTPELPQPKTAIHDRLSMGSSIKFWVLYRTPFWRKRGLNGTILRDDVPTTPIMDVSPTGQDRGLLVGFFDGNHAIRHADLTTEDRRIVVLEMLAEHFGPEALRPLDYIDHDWTDEEWSGGCYGAYAPPGVFARYGEHLRIPIGPLHWAGTETASEWTGYIEGAIQSGERAAGEIMRAMPVQNDGSA